MNQYIKAEALLVYIGNLEFDGIKIIETGEYRMNQVQILQPIGVATNWFNTLGKKKGTKIGTLTSNGFVGSTIFIEYIKNGTKTRGASYSISDVLAVWRYFAMKGNELAQKFCGLPVTGKPARKKEKSVSTIMYSEEWYKLRLQSSLGGEAEVATQAGNIDLLTESELIEIKHIKQWKAAIGQLLIYGFYYPTHTLRLHLFGECKDSTFSFIQGHCTRLGIQVTREDFNKRL